MLRLIATALLALLPTAAATQAARQRPGAEDKVLARFACKCAPTVSPAGP